MSKLVQSFVVAAFALVLPLAALADISGTQTLSSGQIFNLDTGLTASSGGDIEWSGTNLTPAGNATAADLASLGFTGSAAYGEINSSLVSEFGSEAGLSSSPITPAVNDIILVKTNGGNYAKMLVTSVGSSITFQYTTFGASGSGGNGGGGGPTITGITNNYSNIPPGAPNYGIAPGSLFVIYGSGLATGTNTDEKFPLKQTLLSTSISVTVGGKTVTPGMYYVYPTQIAAVLPSTTPTGTGTITVNNGNQSAQAQITVVDSAFGIDTVYGTGTGQGVATDTNYNLISYNNSTKPGQYITFWGSGVGADTADDDLTYPLPHQDNLTSIPMTAYVGGIQATVYYRGRSQFPGVDQVIVIVPQGVTPGCNVGVWFVSGSAGRDSNFTAIPVSADGGPCSDANSVFGGTSISSLSGQSTVNLGFLEVFQDNSITPAFPSVKPAPHLRVRAGLPFHPAAPRPRATGTTASTDNSAIGDFEQVQGAEFANYASYETASIGSCVVWQYTYTTSPPAPPFKYTGLDAGTITVTNGAGQTETLTKETIVEASGLYDAELPDGFIGSTGGSFSFKGTGGKDIGPLSTSVSIGTPLFSWTEYQTITNITRSTGVTVHWTGGIPGTYVEISGYSSDSAVYGYFYCLAPQSALSFTVPGAVTSALPAGSGELSLDNISDPVKFTATNLDIGFAFAATLFDNDTITYQ